MAIATTTSSNSSNSNNNKRQPPTTTTKPTIKKTTPIFEIIKTIVNHQNRPKQMKTHQAIPDAQCMVYLPTKLDSFWGVNVGKLLAAPLSIWVWFFPTFKRFDSLGKTRVTNSVPPGHPTGLLQCQGESHRLRHRQRRPTGRSGRWFLGFKVGRSSHQVKMGGIIPLSFKKWKFGVFQVPKAKWCWHLAHLIGDRLIPLLAHLSWSWDVTCGPH